MIALFCKSKKQEDVAEISENTKQLAEKFFKKCREIDEIHAMVMEKAKEIDGLCNDSLLLHNKARS
jgi:hypothetical protein